MLPLAVCARRHNCDRVARITQPISATDLISIFSVGVTWTKWTDIVVLVPRSADFPGCLTSLSAGVQRTNWPHFERDRRVVCSTSCSSGHAVPPLELAAAQSVARLVVRRLDQFHPVAIRVEHVDQQASGMWAGCWHDRLEQGPVPEGGHPVEQPLYVDAGEGQVGGTWGRSGRVDRGWRRVDLNKFQLKRSTIAAEKAGAHPDTGPGEEFTDVASRPPVSEPPQPESVDIELCAALEVQDV